MAERVTRAFWPLWTVLFFVLAPVLLGWQDHVPLEVLWAYIVFSCIGLLAAAYYGFKKFRWPTRAEATARVDSRLTGRPIATLSDAQTIGAGDAASEAVWETHLRRMEDASRAAKPVQPDLRVSRFDPYGLRYIALLCFVVSLLGGSLSQFGRDSLTTRGTGVPIATGPLWEGWVEPPVYTGLPTLYLSDVTGRTLNIPQGSMITIRLYGDVGELNITETVSDRVGKLPPTSDPQQNFMVERSGDVQIIGDDTAHWVFDVVPDTPPRVSFAGPVEVEATGEMSQPFAAGDDYGVIAGTATFELAEDLIDRRYGLAIAPDPREPLILDLPMPFTQDRADFEENLVDDLSQHPWANLPVTLTLRVEDEIGQEGVSETENLILPGRRFFQPIAKAVIEQRRDLLWSKSNAIRVAQILRAISNKPEGFFPNETTYLRLRVTIRRLEAAIEDGMPDEAQEEISTALWDLAIQLEEGTLSDARERMQRAQERLSEAMRNGASDAEIQELMDELRAATDEYMRMLAQNAQPQENQTDQPDSGQENTEISQSEIDALMDRIQELMEEGRMAEAQQLMEQLNELMQNLQMTQSQNGEGMQTPGEQSMQDLADTLRDQQDLNDDAFRELQDQFNQSPQNQQGQESPGQSGQEGTQQSPGGGTDTQPSDQDGAGSDGGEMDLAGRQNALREGLEQLRNAIPGLDGDAADRAEDALDRAETAMEGAEEALRDGDLPEAIDQQSAALDALREGMRNLSDALAENERDSLENGQGTQMGEAQEGRPMPRQRDPLGRQMGTTGQLGSNDSMIQDEINRRAEELLKELRDRSAEQDRPRLELDYLKRLLDRF